MPPWLVRPAKSARAIRLLDLVNILTAHPRLNQKLLVPSLGCMAYFGAVGGVILWLNCPFDC